MSIQAWLGLQWPKSPTHEEADTEITQLPTGVCPADRRGSEGHSISLIVQDVAPVFRKTKPKLIVCNSLRMENKLLLTDQD